MQNTNLPLGAPILPHKVLYPSPVYTSLIRAVAYRLPLCVSALDR